MKNFSKFYGPYLYRILKIGNFALFKKLFNYNCNFDAKKE